MVVIDVNWVVDMYTCTYVHAFSRNYNNNYYYVYNIDNNNTTMQSKYVNLEHK